MRQLQVQLNIEQCDNGYMLVLGADMARCTPSRRYVFNSLSDLQDFITNYLEDA